MGLDSIIGKIEKEAEAEISKIEEETEKEKQQILRDARKRADDASAKKVAEAKKHAESVMIQEISSAELEAKKIRLNTQKEILDQTYRECLAALNSLQHDRILSSLIAKSKKEMPDAVYVYSNKRDEKAVRTVSGLSYAGNIDCIGGLIVENRERTLRLDYRYETIAQAVWNRSLKEIADKLFK